ncbi:hypothetical protein [Cellulomonas sp. Leaf334]|uniref:hypothetical protein n=1 Tax=Cellulomonas sp. Leaf334 TaxID=1736339 RepID=UPI0006F29546|nr:hypothetical protein [Cellulomonas sp. Leaf334]KQR15993.1 hypothetical protein ASF78_00665 [Cellulomonas sp. Leaf334]
MGDVFDRLAARAAGTAPALAFRRASRFEPGRGREAAGTPSAGVVPLEVERFDVAPRDGRAPKSPRPDPPVSFPPEPPGRDVLPAVGRRTTARRVVAPLVPAPDVAPLEDLVGAAPRTPAVPATGTPPLDPVAARPATTRPSARPEQPGTEPDHPAVAADVPPLRPAAAATGLPPAPDRPGDDPGETTPTASRGADRPRREEAAATGQPGSRTVPAALLLDQLAPALLDARALTRREAERLVAVPTTSPRRVRPDGRGQVRLDDVRVGAGEVHVHVDRIEVSREPAPVPAPARPAASSPAIDHAAYLARQDRRWAR